VKTSKAGHVAEKHLIPLLPLLRWTRRPVDLFWETQPRVEVSEDNDQVVLCCDVD